MGSGFVTTVLCKTLQSAASFLIGSGFHEWDLSTLLFDGLHQYLPQWSKPAKICCWCKKNGTISQTPLGFCTIRFDVVSLSRSNGFNHPTSFLLMIEKMQVHNGKYVAHITVYEEGCVGFVSACKWVYDNTTIVSASFC